MRGFAKIRKPSCELGGEGSSWESRRECRHTAAAAAAAARALCRDAEHRIRYGGLQSRTPVSAATKLAQSLAFFTRGEAKDKSKRGLPLT